jgi:hypothetical protein
MWRAMIRVQQAAESWKAQQVKLDAIVNNA